MCTKTWHETQQVYCPDIKFAKVASTDVGSTNCTHWALVTLQVGRREKKCYRQNYSIRSNLFPHGNTLRKHKARFQAI